MHNFPFQVTIQMFLVENVGWFSGLTVAWLQQKQNKLYFATDNFIPDWAEWLNKVSGSIKAFNVTMGNKHALICSRFSVTGQGQDLHWWFDACHHLSSGLPVVTLVHCYHPPPAVSAWSRGDDSNRQTEIFRLSPLSSLSWTDNKNWN